MKKFLLIVAIFLSIFVIDQAHAQGSGSIGKELFDKPFDFLQPDGKGFKFLLFVIGIAIYSLFVWHFYRFISRRDLFPKFFYKLSVRREKKTIHSSNCRL